MSTFTLQSGIEGGMAISGGLEKGLKVNKRGVAISRGVEKAPRWISMGWAVRNGCGVEKTNICIG